MNKLNLMSRRGIFSQHKLVKQLTLDSYHGIFEIRVGRGLESNVPTGNISLVKKRGEGFNFYKFFLTP